MRRATVSPAIVATTHGTRSVRAVSTVRPRTRHPAAPTPGTSVAARAATATMTRSATVVVPRSDAAGRAAEAGGAGATALLIARPRCARSTLREALC